MSENSTEAAETASERTTVRQFRHDAANRLREAQAAIGGGRFGYRDAAQDRLYRLVNGVISGILKGRQGLSQEGQVKQIDRAIRQANKNKETVAEVAAEAQASVAASKEAEIARLEEQIARYQARLEAAKASQTAEGFADIFTTALDETVAILTEAKAFAQNRDFAAHQEAKGNPVGDQEGPDGGPVDVNGEPENAVAPPAEENDPEADEY